MSCAHAFGEWCSECIDGLVRDYNAARKRIAELEAAPSGWQQRIAAVARRASAEIEKLVLGAEFGPDDAALWDAPDGVERQTVVRIIEAAILEASVADEWRRRITDMEPWGRGGNCHFCGVYRQWERDGKWVDATHNPDCLWQNAKDALPPAPEGSPAPSEFDDLLGHLVVAARCDRRVDSTDKLMSTLAAVDGVKEAIRQSWKCGGCGHGFATVGHMLHVSDERAAASSEADASPAKETPDPIAAAVDAQLKPLADDLTAFGHKLAKGLPEGDA